MKKCLILFLAICILTTSFVSLGVSASGYTGNDVFGFLEALGIFSQVQESKKDLEISRIEFAVFAAKMIGIDEQEASDKDYFYDIPSDHWGKASVNALVERSVIYGDGQKNFRPDDIITLPEAVVILIRLMRIEYEATSNGGYPGGYIRTATKYDIISPSMSNKGNLTYQDAAMLIYNTLNTRVEHLGSIGTLLSMYHGVYYGEGRINAVYGASVNEEKVPEIGQVSIGGKTFLCGNSWFYDRLGIYVRYYYRKTEGLDQIVYISEDNNIKSDVIEITSDNYEGFADGHVEYYQSEASSGTKKARIYDGVTVIRNGQNVSGDLKYAFSDFYGTMKLIKTGKNESADVVIIEDYENIEAGHINSKEKVIYDKNNSSFSVNLSDKDGEFIYYVDTEGNASSFDKIGAEDIISVAQSKDRSFTKVIISANSVTGVIEGTKASKNSLIIKLDGGEYEFEEGFYNSENPQVIVGETATIKLDLFGRIAGYELGKSQGFKYAFIVNAVIDDKAECVKIKMFTEDNEMLVADCATWVKIDADKVTTNEAIIRKLSAKGEVSSQLVRFKRNSQNKIVEIDTKEPGLKESELSLHRMETEQTLYKHWTNLLGYNAYVPTSVKVMVVPEEGSEKMAKDDQFQVKNITAIPSGKSSRVDIFQIDENSLNIDFVVYHTTIQSNVDTYAALQVVEEISQGLTDEGDLTTMLKLDSSGNSVTYAVSADYVSTDGKYKNPDLTLIGEGDVIRIATNYKNEIASIELILDYSQAKADGDAHFFDNALNPSYKAKNGVAVGNFFDGFKMSYGYASRTSGNLVQWGYDKPGDANEIYNVTFDSNKAKIIVYDEDDKEDPCKLGSIKDIVGYYSSSGDYSKLICVSRSAIITNMVVYK